jgi:hypothetical protein
MPSGSIVPLRQTYEDQSLSCRPPAKLVPNAPAILMLGTFLAPLIFLGASQIITNTILQSLFWACFTNIMPIISLCTEDLERSSQISIALSTVFSAGIFLLGTLVPIQLVSITAILLLCVLVKLFKFQTNMEYNSYFILYPLLSNILHLILPFSILGNAILIAISKGLINASILFLLTKNHEFRDFY